MTARLYCRLFGRFLISLRGLDLLQVFYGRSSCHCIVPSQRTRLGNRWRRRRGAPFVPRDHQQTQQFPIVLIIDNEDQ